MRRSYAIDSVLGDRRVRRRAGGSGPHDLWVEPAVGFISSKRLRTHRGGSVHLICDNYATHKITPIIKWLAAHPRFDTHFTPTYSSWFNQVERWFAFLTDKQLRRACAPRSMRWKKTSATAGTRTPYRSPGPRPPTTSSNYSPHIFIEILARDTSGLRPARHWRVVHMANLDALLPSAGASPTGPKNDGESRLLGDLAFVTRVGSAWGVRRPGWGRSGR